MLKYSKLLHKIIRISLLVNFLIYVTYLYVYFNASMYLHDCITLVILFFNEIKENFNQIMFESKINYLHFFTI